MDFKNTILIMTSNAGAENIISPKRLGFSSESGEKADYAFMKERVMEEVRRMFKPEFLNRIDEILVFHPLTKENIKTIAGILLRGIKKRTEDLLADKGYDSKYGARPLRRTIQTQIEDQLSEKILEGTIRKKTEVRIEKDGDQLKFETV